VQVLQNKALKRQFNYNRFYSTEKLYKELKLGNECSINKKVFSESLCAVHQILNGRSSSEIILKSALDIHSYFTRFSKKLRTKMSKSTKYGSKGVKNIDSLVGAYNSLSRNTKEAKSYASFKRLLKGECFSADGLS